MPLNADEDIDAVVDVLLICALKDEYDQVLKVTDGLTTPGWGEHQLANGWIVADGRFTNAFGVPLKIRATHASYMGREQVQAMASKLIHEQPTRCIAMSGICAGRRDKVALGDVIIAERLWSYDAGKLTIENEKKQFQGDILQYRPSSGWLQQMQHLRIPSNTPWLLDRPEFPLEYQEDWVMLRILDRTEPHQHPDFDKECPNWSEVLPRLWRREWLDKTLELTAAGREHAKELNQLYRNGLSKPTGFQIHVAPMATGATVTEDTGIFPRLAESMRKVLGVEMEASALGALGECHGIPVLVVKGVSDYGDSFKDDRYRNFAARAAAECLISLLRDGAKLLLNQIPGTRSAVNLANISIQTSMKNIPIDLIQVLAEEYPDVRDARALWQRAGGKASEVESISRPRDLWQRLWLRSMQGASACPGALLQEALKDLPDNEVLHRYIKSLLPLNERIGTLND